MPTAAIPDSIVPGDPAIAGWTDDQRALWARLVAHPFADPALALDFTARLAREQGWRRAEATAAVGEYRRFCFLAVFAGHAVTPSAAVDEVWHLHLTYTRDYWQRFCPAVLGTELHHGPTPGGTEAQAQYREQYARTLASYTRFFGQGAPAAWWPSAAERFGNPARFVRVDRARTWLLPRPRWALRRERWASPGSRLLPLVTLLLLPLPLAAASGLPLNPFDWDGPAFLKLYVVLLAMAWLLVALWRQAYLGPASDTHGAGAQAKRLDTWEIALLGGGPPRVLQAATAALLADGHARFDPHGGLQLVGDSGRNLPPPLRDYAPLISGAPVLDRTGAAAAQAAVFQPLEAKLVQKRLLVAEPEREAGRRQARWLFGALLAFGAVKLAVGLLRDRPVGFLVLLLGMTLLLLWRHGWRRRPWRTRAGEAVLRHLRQAEPHLLRAPATADLARAVALGAGAAALAGTAYADVLAHQQVSQRGAEGGGVDGGAGYDYGSGDVGSGSSDAGGSSGGDGGSDGGGSDGGGSGCGGCGGGGGGD